MTCRPQRRSLNEAEERNTDMDGSCGGIEQTYASGVEESWKSTRLGAVIKQEFKRHYKPEERSTAMDLQAVHTSRMDAGSYYVRDLREGPRQVASLRAEFRLLSRK